MASYDTKRGGEFSRSLSVRPASQAIRPGLTSALRVGMIRGLICFAIPQVFEEFDGGQQPFRQKTRNSG
jgi:hypothetical protein